MLKNSTIILVLGMHRSGTSATTRLLDILGADLGKNLFPGASSNEGGFWENRKLIEIHDNIFEELKSSWFDFRSLPDDWWKDKNFLPYHKKILKVIKSDFKSHDLLAIKDPRLCRQLPMWLDIIGQAGGSTKCLIVLRNPIEVTRSLTRRDSFDTATSLYLWLIYTLESEFYSRGLPRTIIKFDSVLSDWKTTASKIANDFDIQWPKASNEIESIIANELKPGLRHHKLSEEQNKNGDELTEIACTVYNKLLSPITNKEEQYFDSIRTQIYKMELVSEPLGDVLHRTNNHLLEKTRELQIATKEIADPAEVFKIYTIWSAIKRLFQ